MNFFEAFAKFSQDVQIGVEKARQSLARPPLDLDADFTHIAQSIDDLRESVEECVFLNETSPIRVHLKSSAALFNTYKQDIDIIEAYLSAYGFKHAGVKNNTQLLFVCFVQVAVF
jgi:hypothetical protein